MVLLLVSTLTVMAGATISPVLPGLAAEFSSTPGSATLVPLLLSAPALAIAICAPVVGAVIDRIGRRPVLLAAVALYGVAGGAGLVIGDLWLLLASRVALGVGVAGIMVTATALVADYFDGERRSHVLGLQAAFIGFGGTVFLSLGGVLGSLDTRGPFAIYLLALVLLPFVWRVIDEPARHASRGPAGAGGGGGKARLRDSWRLLAVVYALGLLGMLSFYTIPTRLPFLLETLTGAGPTVAGFSVALNTLAGAVVSLSYGRIRSRFGFGTLAVATAVLLGSGLIIIGFAGGLPLVLVGLLLVGCGVGLLLPTVNGWIAGGTPAAVRGAARGWLSNAIYVGQFGSPLLSSPLAQASGSSTVFTVAGIVALVGAVVLVVVLSSRERRESLQASGPPARAA